MGRLVKMQWNCPFCGTKDISGSSRECPNCGHPMEENLKFHLPKDIKNNYVPDEEAKRINRNPHWRCAYCGTYNSDNDKTCVSCSATRTKENKNYFEVQKENDEKKKEIASDYINASDNSNSKTVISKSINTSIIKRISKINYKIVATILLLILGIVGIVYVLAPKDRTMQVTSLSWERSIEIQRFQTVSENDWSLPYGAHLLYTREEISGYSKVIDHYETKTRTVSKQVLEGYEEVVIGYKDLGNGYAEEITTNKPIYRTEYYNETYEEPIYKTVPTYETKYYYEIDKWLYERRVTTSGTTDAPYWGEVELNDDERTGSKSQYYYVTGIVNEKEKTYSFSFEDWSEIEVGNEIRLKETLGYATLIKEDSD